MSRNYDVITFDCYGTLIDWESGISNAIRAAAGTAGLDPSREQIVRHYHEVEPMVQAAAYRPYRQVLCDVAVAVAERLGWSLQRTDSHFLPNSLVAWPAFPDTNSALRNLRERGYRLGILSNVDDDLLAGTVNNLSVEFDIIVTAQQVRAYKPKHAHFVSARELIGDRRWLHAAQSYFHDVEPAVELEIPAFWVNRKRDEPTGNARPVAQAETLTGLVEWLDGSD
jgi:2-haloalkanoic acid dehalogenase type II